MFVLFPVSAQPIETETHHYLERTGSKTSPVEWKFEKGVVPKITWVGSDETITTWSNPSLETVKWVVDKPGQNTLITVQRTNNDLIINGVLKGSPLEKKVKIDNLPWFQAISISLRPFIISKDSALEFWTFQPDTLKIYKLRALKVSADVLKINSNTIKAQKVKISLTGILSVFGECFYWFTKDDGVFIRYEGPGTSPEKKVTVEMR
uniref:Uncharacterized protein n=1 Tax=uncultured Desulfobacterium sp. TaxID=201089 RepID=E1YHX6_9BACT|nr:hypothetical protein N47_D30540 [uncultured Desulfobacterium sp.]